MQNSNNMQKVTVFHKALVGTEDDDGDEALFYLNQPFILRFKISRLHQRCDCSPWVTVNHPSILAKMDLLGSC